MSSRFVKSVNEKGKRKEKERQKKEIKNKPAKVNFLFRYNNKFDITLHTNYYYYNNQFSFIGDGRMLYLL